jgi:hypothetical protein
MSRLIILTDKNPYSLTDFLLSTIWTLDTLSQRVCLIPLTGIKIRIYI